MKAERTRIVEKIVEAWNSGNINYAAASGIEDYPDAIGRDLDVVMQADHVREALNVAHSILRADGWSVAYPHPIWGKRLLAAKGDKWSSALEIHTLTKLAWRNVVFVASIDAHPLQVGPFKVDPWITFVKRVLMPLLADGKAKACTFTEGTRAIVMAKLQRYCGQALAQQLYQAVSARDVDAMADLLPALRKRIAFRAAVHAPLASAQASAHFFYRKVAQPFIPCTPIIAILSRQSDRKSFYINALTENRSVFTEVIVRETRPDHLFSTFSNFFKDWIGSGRQRLIIYPEFPFASPKASTGGLLGRGARYLAAKMFDPDLVLLIEDSGDQPASGNPARLSLGKRNTLLQVAESEALVVVDGQSQGEIRRVRDTIIETFLKKNGGLSNL